MNYSDLLMSGLSSTSGKFSKNKLCFESPPRGTCFLGFGAWGPFGRWVSMWVKSGKSCLVRIAVIEESQVLKIKALIIITPP